MTKIILDRKITWTLKKTVKTLEKIKNLQKNLIAAVCSYNQYDIL